MTSSVIPHFVRVSLHPWNHQSGGLWLSCFCPQRGCVLEWLLIIHSRLICEFAQRHSTPFSFSWKMLQVVRNVWVHAESEALSRGRFYSQDDCLHLVACLEIKWKINGNTHWSASTLQALPVCKWLNNIYMQQWKTLTTLLHFNLLLGNRCWIIHVHKSYVFLYCQILLTLQ